jgi:hypothetical protein
MIRDVVVLVVLVTAFAVLATVHCALAFAIGRRASLGRALVAFVLPPLAPWWGWRHGLRVRSSVWIASALAYAVARVLSAR